MKKQLKIVAATFIIGSLIACNNIEKKGEDNPQNNSIESREQRIELTESAVFVDAIETAHKKNVFSTVDAIQFELGLNFGGKTRFNGTITMTPNGDKIRMQDSTMIMIWDGEKAIIAPDTSDDTGARFALFTWSYFFAAPYKLSDPGTKHQFTGVKQLNSKEYTTSKLTFEDNIGDSPDDWYLIYRDDSTNLIASMAYIVTAGGIDQKEAEESPHAITYEAYTQINDIPFATIWNFWTWDETGKLEKLLGHASIKDIQIVEAKEELFSIPSI